MQYSWGLDYVAETRERERNRETKRVINLSFPTFAFSYVMCFRKKYLSNIHAGIFYVRYAKDISTNRSTRRSAAIIGVNSLSVVSELSTDRNSLQAD